MIQKLRNNPLLLAAVLLIASLVILVVATLTAPERADAKMLTHTITRHVSAKFGTYQVMAINVDGKTWVQFTLVKPAKNKAKAHVSDLYNSPTYLHLRNAAWACREFNWQAADQVMRSSVSYGVYRLDESLSEFYDPYSYTRYNNNQIYTNIKYTSNPNSYYKVHYGCGAVGNDQAFGFWVVEQRGGVARN